jgi:hypothetical protein
VVFSPDGTRIVTGSHTAKLWDARAGTPQLELKGHTGIVNSVAFSLDDTRIVTGSIDQTAKVWDARTGTPLLELKGHTGIVKSVAFSPDGTRIVTGSDDHTAKVWDARTGTPLLELKGHTKGVLSVAFNPTGTRIVTRGDRVLSMAFNPTGTRIVTRGDDRSTKVWDARTGEELKGEPIPQTMPNNPISHDGRFLAHLDGSLVDLVPLQLDKEEISYRLLQAQPNVWRFREGYAAARAAKDDFAARFYLNLLPPLEQKTMKAQAAADREIAAGRTTDALVYIVIVSVAKADDTDLSLRLAALQAWFGQDTELADTCGRALKVARGTFDPMKWNNLARICCLRPTTDTACLETALALARKSVGLANANFSFKLTVGMAAYRIGRFAYADSALVDAEGNPEVGGTATFYHAMSLFRQGKENEARNLATDAAAKIKPLPNDEMNPLAGGASTDDLILWLAYKEAKALIKFDAAQAPSKSK